MVELLFHIIERQGNRYSVVEFDGVRYYSLSKAAELSQIPRSVLYRATRKGSVGGVCVQAYRDNSNQLYLTAETIEKLKRVPKYVPVGQLDSI